MVCGVSSANVSSRRGLRSTVSTAVFVVWVIGVLSSCLVRQGYCNRDVSLDPHNHSISFRSSYPLSVVHVLLNV